MDLFLVTVNDECDHKTYGAAEDEENAEITDKVADKGFSGLGIPGKRDAGIGNEVEEKLVNDEYERRYDKHP